MLIQQNIFWYSKIQNSQNTAAFGRKLPKSSQKLGADFRDWIGPGPECCNQLHIRFHVCWTYNLYIFVETFFVSKLIYREWNIDDETGF